jgi:hypothetical protein
VFGIDHESNLDEKRGEVCHHALEALTTGAGLPESPSPRTKIVHEITKYFVMVDTLWHLAELAH